MLLNHIRYEVHLRLGQEPIPMVALIMFQDIKPHPSPNTGVQLRLYSL
jgi:hypothetical protein